MLGFSFAFWQAGSGSTQHSIDDKYLKQAESKQVERVELDYPAIKWTERKVCKKQGKNLISPTGCFLRILTTQQPARHSIVNQSKRI